MNNKTEVLIVGAGPAGLTLASFLAMYTVPFIIIDKKHAISSHMKACMLSSRSLEIFSDLNLLPRALELGQRVNAFDVYREKQLSVSLNYSLIQTRFPFNLHLGQPYTEKILLENLTAKNHAVLWEHTLLSIAQTEDEVIASIVVSKKIKKIRARFLIGADGAASVVRTCCRLSFVGDTYPSHFLLGRVKLDWALSRDKARLFLGDFGFLSVYPLPDDQMQVGGNIAAPDHAHPDIRELKKLFSDRCCFDGELYDIQELSYYRTHARFAKKYIVNRVILLGDAAHIVSPLTGLGMNAGIQDAENLAWKLLWIYKKQATMDLLQSYENERQWVARKLHSFSNILETVYNAQQDNAKNLREFMLSHSLTNKAAQKNEVMRLMQKDLHYRTCLPAGFQSPDPWIPSRAAFLFDLFSRGKCIILTFSGVNTQKPFLTFSCVDYDDWMRIQYDVANVCERENSVREVCEARMPNASLQGCIHGVFSSTILMRAHSERKSCIVNEKQINDPDLTIHQAFSVETPTRFFIRPDRYVANVIAQEINAA